MRFRISIQSKILVALLLSSIMSVAVVGFIGAVSGRNALREVESERLIELRESQKRQIEALFRQVTNSLIVYSGGFSIQQAVTAFAAGFDQLANSTISPAQQQAIVTYYQNEMIKPIARLTGEDVDLNAVMPSTNAQKYLQAYYTAAPRQDSTPVLDAGDGSAWSAANARFDFYMRGIVTRFDYRDALLLDLDGNVVYSANKGPDLGTNVLTGPYRESNLREAYQKALRANDVDFVWITDFQPYQPSSDAPTAWVVSPIGVGGKVDGVMALPLPIAKINNIMTANKHWEAAGMGAATETYLAGPDTLMRSDSRLFLEDPQEYRREVIAAGTRARHRGPSDPVGRHATGAARSTVRGCTPRNAAKPGMIDRGRLHGQQELEAYAPIVVPNSDLQWSILATRDDSDAFARLWQVHQSLAVGVDGDDFRNLRGLDADRTGGGAAGPAPRGGHAADQLRRLRSRDPGDVARRNRRSHRCFQRDEPEPRDQGGTPQRAAQENDRLLWR